MSALPIPSWYDDLPEVVPAGPNLWLIRSSQFAPGDYHSFKYTPATDDAPATAECSCLGGASYRRRKLNTECRHFPVLIAWLNAENARPECRYAWNPHHACARRDGRALTGDEPCWLEARAQLLEQSGALAEASKAVGG